MEFNNEEKKFLKSLCGGGYHEEEDKCIKDFYLSRMKGGNATADKKRLKELAEEN